MPKVINTITGEEVASVDYTDPNPAEKAQDIADTDPKWDVQYAPGGSYDAGGRVQNISGYFGGGMVADYMGGYSPLKPKLGLEKGGKVEKKK